MRVPPFYGPWRNNVAEDVWHNDDECPIGQRIPLEERRSGTDHVRLRCTRCAALGQPSALPPAPAAPSSPPVTRL